MRKLSLFIVVAAISLVLSAASGKEAKVEWKKVNGGVEYTVSFVKDFKLNKKAPFKFFLKDKDGKDIKKVAWNDFKKAEDGKYKFVSKNGEKKTYYWFVACKYQKDEIVACKTFSEKFEIK